MRIFTRCIQKIIFPVMIMGLFIGARAQSVPANIGTNISGNYVDTVLNQFGIFGQYRYYADSSIASGIAKVEFPVSQGNFNPVWRSYSAGNILLGYNQIIDTTQVASARYNSASGGSGILLPAITAGMYYTFNVQNHATGSIASDTMAILQTAYNPVTITNVSIPVDTNTIGPACSPLITATFSDTLATGEYAYLRYSLTGFLDASYVVLMTPYSDSTATAQIPAYPAGTSIQYYVLTSNISNLLTSGQGSAYYDCQTLNLKNGSIGNNFRYTVKTLGVPSVSIAVANNTVCQASPAVFTAHGVNNGTVASDYQWYKDGIAVGANDSVYTDFALVSGDSIWVVMQANLGCPVSDTSNHIVMTVNPTPAPIGFDTSVCPNSVVNLSSLVIDSTNTLIYRLGSQSGPTVSNPVNISSSNTYIVLDSTAATGCYAIDSIVVTESNSLNDSVYAMASDLQYCGALGTDTFTAIPVNGGSSPAYQWTINGVASGTGSMLITGAFHAGDSIQVTMTSSLACPSHAQVSSNIIMVAVNPVPVVTLSWDSLALKNDLGFLGITDTIWCPEVRPHVFLMTGGSPAGGNYSGQFIHNDTFSANIDTFATDIVTYLYTNTFGCSASTVDSFHLSICEGIQNVSAGTINLYPNPNKGSFYLETSGAINTTYTISDVLGHVIAQQPITSGSQQINLPDTDDGIYTIVVQGSQPVRFVIMQ